LDFCSPYPGDEAGGAKSTNPSLRIRSARSSVQSASGVHSPAVPLRNETVMTKNSVPYLLLFRNTGPEVHEHLSVAQREQLGARWNAWYDDLVTQGKAFDGQPLELASRMISGARGARVVDGPFAEAKEAIGGYVKLLVSDLDEATQIAQRHPGLEYGLIIELRPMTNNCHLGVNVGLGATSTESA
jgi:hypothetical protein